MQCNVKADCGDPALDCVLKHASVQAEAGGNRKVDCELAAVAFGDPATALIPVVAISANAMPRDIEMGMKTGFFSYLTKPIKVNELMDAVHAALEFSEKAVRS